MSAYRATGYGALIERYQLDVIPHWHSSFVAEERQVHRIEKDTYTIREYYPKRYWSGEGIGEQLEFALKYDGINLAILFSIFQVMDRDEFLSYLLTRPTGKYARRLWYLYEFLTDEKLPIDDLKQGNYIDLLDNKLYYTLDSGKSIRRQRIRDNQLGNKHFCPTVRRTDKLQKIEGSKLQEKCHKIIAQYPETLLRRALSYLYTKETKSSFEIEHLIPTSSRLERFMALLREAEKEDFCTKDKLILLQNRIVDPRFRDEDYRTNQNYVGESIAFGEEKIHFVTPKPKDLPELMKGLIATHTLMSYGKVDAIIHAATLSYGFVFLHPFEDGNGRIHRFLIHNILAIEGFTPKGIMFPISAVMLKNPELYELSLESYSQKLMPLLEYTLNEEGHMIVSSETDHWYRYIDMTLETEILYDFVQRTIETELVDELQFIINYDRSKKAIQNIIDMPDRQIDLLIRFILQNHGKLSKIKREKYFDFLEDNEIDSIEKAIW